MINIKEIAAKQRRENKHQITKQTKNFTDLEFTTINYKYQTVSILLKL